MFESAFTKRRIHPCSIKECPRIEEFLQRGLFLTVAVLVTTLIVPCIRYDN